MIDVFERFVGDVPHIDAESASQAIGPDDVVLVSGFGSVGYPKAVPTALAASDRDLSLTMVSGGSVGAEIDSALFEAGAIARRVPYQARPESRQAVNDGSVAFHDRHIAGLGDEVALHQYGRPDIAIVEAVAVGKDWFIPTTSVGHTQTYVETADRLVVEVNESQPLALQYLHDIHRVPLPPDRGPIPLSSPGERIGGPKIGFDPDSLVGVVTTDRPDKPYEFRSPTETDRRIAENLSSFLATEMARNRALRERITLQFGVGSLGNALMASLSTFDFGGRDVAYYGEVIQDGLLDMIDDGSLNAASAASLALSTEGFERLFDDIERYAERTVVRNADVSNNPSIIDRFGVVAVNSALEVDLYGHANSTHLNGTHVVNGIGGSGDFSRNALVSVVALSSTAADGDISRIVPMVPHVDHTEHDFSVVVTEHGVADLRGLDPQERANCLIEHCAHPAFRDALDEYRERATANGGHIPHDLDTAFDWHDSANS